MHEFDPDRISGEPPETAEFDRDEFELTTEDGTLWRVEVGEGASLVRDRNGNEITFTADGIFSSSGPDVVITRSGGHVTAITDPTGKSVEYTYLWPCQLPSITFADPAFPLSA